MDDHYGEKIPTVELVLFAFRKEQKHVLVNQAVFIGQDYEKFVQKYAKSVVRYIEGSKFEIKE